MLSKNNNSDQSDYWLPIHCLTRLVMSSSAEWASIWRSIQTSDPFWISLALSSVWSKLNVVMLKFAVRIYRTRFLYTVSKKIMESNMFLSITDWLRIKSAGYGEKNYKFLSLKCCFRVKNLNVIIIMISSSAQNIILFDNIVFTPFILQNVYKK